MYSIFRACCNIQLVHTLDQNFSALLFAQVHYKSVSAVNRSRFTYMIHAYLLGVLIVCVSGFWKNHKTPALQLSIRTEHLFPKKLQIVGRMNKIHMLSYCWRSRFSVIVDQRRSGWIRCIKNVRWTVSYTACWLPMWDLQRAFWFSSLPARKSRKNQLYKQSRLISKKCSKFDCLPGYYVRFTTGLPCELYKHCGLNSGI